MINYEDYSTLVEEMSLEQGLGLVLEQIPLIIFCQQVVYHYCFIIRETDKNLVVIVPDEDGHEHVKIINKECIETVEMLYEDMLLKANEKIKEEKESWGFMYV